jgi:L-threonylcarbamoyladenylate synthase
MTDKQKCLEIFKTGGIVIFPTDTAYGIGCRMDNEQTIRRLFKIRNRPLDQPMPVLLGSKEMVRRYFVEKIPQKLNIIMNKFWPGGLTIIYYYRSDLVSPLITAGKKNIGLRIPDHTDLRDIINTLGVGILGPSANFHGQKTPYKFNQIDSELIKLVDYVYKGESKSNLASTVLDCTQKKFKIVRHGAVKEKNLFQYI